jgi:hypothetical protein
VSRSPTGFDNRATAGDAAFVDSRPQSLVDLFQQHLPNGIGSVQPQAALLKLLGKPSKAPRSCLSHQIATYFR